MVGLLYLKTISEVSNNTYMNITLKVPDERVLL